MPVQKQSSPTPTAAPSARPEVRKALLTLGVVFVIIVAIVGGAVMFGGTLAEMAKGTHGPAEAARGFFADVQRGDIAHARSGAKGAIDEKYLESLHTWFGQQGFHGCNITDCTLKNDVAEVKGYVQFGSQSWQVSLVYKNEGGKWMLASIAFMSPQGDIVNSVIQM